MELVKKSIDNEEYGVIHIGNKKERHGILPIGYKEYSDKLAVNVYDSNHPKDAERYLYIRKEEKNNIWEYNSWEYEIEEGRIWDSNEHDTLFYTQGSLNVRNWLDERGVVVLPKKEDVSTEKTDKSNELRLFNTKRDIFKLIVDNQPVNIEHNNSDDIKLVLPISISSDVIESSNLSASGLFWVADENISYIAETADVFSVTDNEDIIEFKIPKDTTVDISKETDNGKTATVVGAEGQKITVTYSQIVNGQDIEYSIIGIPSNQVNLSMYNEELDVTGFISGTIIATTDGRSIEQKFLIDSIDKINIKQGNGNEPVITIPGNVDTPPEQDKKPEHNSKPIQNMNTSQDMQFAQVYTITFDANGGNCDVKTMFTNKDGKLPNLPNAIKTNFVFKGWFMEANGGEQITTNTVFNGNTTVYAQWVESVAANEKKVSKSPQTGDDINIILISVLMLICISTLLILYKYQYKENF